MIDILIESEAPNWRSTPGILLLDRHTSSEALEVLHTKEIVFSKPLPDIDMCYCFKDVLSAAITKETRNQIRCITFKIPDVPPFIEMSDGDDAHSSCGTWATCIFRWLEDHQNEWYAENRTCHQELRFEFHPRSPEEANSGDSRCQQEGVPKLFYDELMEIYNNEYHRFWRNLCGQLGGADLTTEALSQTYIPMWKSHWIKLRREKVTPERQPKHGQLNLASDSDSGRDNDFAGAVHEHEVEGMDQGPEQDPGKALVRVAAIEEPDDKDSKGKRQCYVLKTWTLDSVSDLLTSSQGQTSTDKTRQKRLRRFRCGLISAVLHHSPLFMHFLRNMLRESENQKEVEADWHYAWNGSTLTLYWIGVDDTLRLPEKGSRMRNGQTILSRNGKSTYMGLETKLKLFPPTL
jgi:hypothetical protein